MRAMAGWRAGLALVAAVALAVATPALAQQEGDPGSGDGSTTPAGSEYEYDYEYEDETSYSDDSLSSPEPEDRGAAQASGGLSRARLAPGSMLESIVVGPAGDRAAVEALAARVGATILRGAELPALGQFNLILTFPSDAARAAFAEALAREQPASGVSLHWIYSFAQAQPRVYAPALIGEVEPGRCRLARPVRIGMIDGPVATDHPALRGARVRHVALVPPGRAAPADHGTAVAALLVGEDPSGLLGGFARGADLVAVSVFAGTDEGEETAVELIVAALDRLVAEGAQVVNLSLAGPESAALRAGLAAAARRGVVMVGAAGNGRARSVAWPAAAPEVIAVTAVDAARRRFRLANIGAETEFAAPGVDIYAARARGAGYVSGTSFAAPIVTALVARQIAAGTRSADGARARLRAGVQPLGTGPRNPEFGWGLVRGGC
jgi:hypothetical protein